MTLLLAVRAPPSNVVSIAFHPYHINSHNILRRRGGENAGQKVVVKEFNPKDGDVPPPSPSLTRRRAVVLLYPFTAGCCWSCEYFRQWQFGWLDPNHSTPSSKLHRVTANEREFLLHPHVLLHPTPVCLPIGHDAADRLVTTKQLRNGGMGA